MSQSIPSARRAVSYLNGGAPAVRMACAHIDETTAALALPVDSTNPAGWGAHRVVTAVTFADLATFDVAPESKGSAPIVRALRKRGWVKTATGYALP